MCKLVKNSPLVLFVFLSSLTPVFSQSKLQHTDQASAGTSVGSLNINNLWMPVSNDGCVGQDSARFGVTYPLFNGNVIFRDNLIWVGQVQDGSSPLIRTGGATYFEGVLPGSITTKGVAENPGAESARVFRYRPDFQTSDLVFDAAASRGIDISKVTPELTSALRQQYARDLAEWPWQKGAPFVDKNGNGRLDPGELPGLENASQLAWLSYNDLGDSVSRTFAGDPPIGLEVQLTLWGYHNVPNLEDIIFKRYRVIYKGTSQTPSTARVDSMYLTQWFDPDIGDESDDLAGCDSALSLGYGYNSIRNGNDQDTVYKSLHLPTPGIAYAVLQGPLVPAPNGDSGIFGFRRRANSKNLPMTACVVHITGHGDEFGEPSPGSRSYFYWNISRGCRTGFLDKSLSYSPILDPNGWSTKFMYYGDPATRAGWTAFRPRGGTTDFFGGDPRVFMSVGPFSMALGDTQEVVIAVIAGGAPTLAENIAWLRNRAGLVQAIYPNLGDYVAGFVTEVADKGTVPTEFGLDQNFPNPFNPSTQIRFRTPQGGQVRISIFDLLGQVTRALYDGVLNAGEHTISWDGRDVNGDPAPTGVYFYRLTQGERQMTRKLLLLR